MVRKPRRPEVGKWFATIRCDWDWVRADRYSRRLEIALIRLLRTPPEGVEPAHGKDYRGFRFVFCFRIPFYVERWR